MPNCGPEQAKAERNYLHHIWRSDIKLQDSHTFDSKRRHGLSTGAKMSKMTDIFLLLEDFLLFHNEASMSKPTSMRASAFSNRIQ